ncbi:hypothetical protein KL906_001095 [Ogataea polymorpha]|nr:hypothetical protein KL906_001095 [Ogataea polymorpha]
MRLSFAALLVAVQAFRLGDLQIESSNWPATDSVPSDDDLIKISLDELYSIGNSTKLSDCDKCKHRLLYAKSLALVKPTLIPSIFTEWCIGTNALQKDMCLRIFGRTTVQNSYAGSNFADMVSLMDPISYDGDYYCHYTESACDYVSPPEIDGSELWGGSKPEKSKYAPEAGNETFYVLHVSDFHIENDYVVGGEGNCSVSMCCTPHSFNNDPVPQNYDISSNLFLQDGPGEGWSFYKSSYVDNIFEKGPYVGYNESTWWPATSFGHYNCDAPELLINSTLKAATSLQQQLNLNYEFAIFTGDLVDHDETQYITYESTLLAEESTFRDVKYQLGDIPMFPVLGNHDTFPYGQLAQEKYGFSNKFDWNNELMAELWRDYDWIDFDEEQQVREHYTGFSVKTKRGLKIIALNSNSWYISNLYAFINISQDYDSFGQFQFLVDELLDSESKDERVWLIMHVPAGADMLPVASQVFAQVVERFSPYTIAGIFNGHTHRDEFKVLYSGFNGSNLDAQTAENAIANTWIAPSVTSWIGLNPSFRFLEVDSKTFSVMNAYTYYFNLNETFTNNGTEPEWRLEYDARSAYGVNWPQFAPLNATYWHEVSQKIGSSSSSLQQYENFATRYSPYTYKCSESDNCDTFYCYVSTFTIDQYVKCCEHFGLDSDI